MSVLAPKQVVQSFISVQLVSVKSNRLLRTRVYRYSVYSVAKGEQVDLHLKKIARNKFD